MAEVMRHEPFHKVGSLQARQDGLAAGWALDADPACTANPVWNPAHDICLVRTGEIHADGDEADVERCGSLDGPALLRRYEALGSGFVDALDGCFAALVIDLRHHRVLLVNDRHGLCRIYLHVERGAWHLASEAKALLRLLPSTRQLDDTGLAEHLSCGCALGGRTLFRNVSLLPPASRWIFSSGRLIRRERYVDPRAVEALPILSEGDYLARLTELFPRLLRRQLGGQRHIGVSLTGGLDGRMIMACCAEVPTELSCYTFGGPLRDCHDVQLARRVAQACGRKHQVIRVGEDFLDHFLDLATQAVYLSDGALDVSGAVELHVNRLARQIAPVRLTGNYGSEVLRRNIAFRPQPLPGGVFAAALEQASHLAAQTYAELTHMPRLAVVTRRQLAWHHPARLAVEQSQLTLRSPYLDQALVQLAWQAPATLRTSPRAALHVVAQLCPALAAIPTDRGLLHAPCNARQHGLLETLPTGATSDWRRPGIWKRGRTGVDHLLREASFRAEYAWDYGMPQWLLPLERACSRWHPERLFLGRHKFYHFRTWYRDRLSEPLRQVLLDPPALNRPHLAHPATLPRLLEEHLNGQRNHTSALHQLLSIELIHRQFIDTGWDDLPQSDPGPACTSVIEEVLP
jgi:asparagine synthase (glutamine-hydrolysing)